MLDFFGSDNPDDFMSGFPWHPHRGMETVTYMLEGKVEHEDSLGNRGVIGHGDIQWMTAGSGIIHQEMPKYEEGAACFDENRKDPLHAGEGVLFSSGDSVLVKTETSKARFILIAGKPIGEPIAWRGSIVMNTNEDLNAAFRELRNNTFIKS